MGQAKRALANGARKSDDWKSTKTTYDKLETVLADIHSAEDDEITAEIVKFAREQLDDLIASKEASDEFVQVVNGIANAPLESVGPNGKIVFLFVYWHLAIPWAIMEARKLVAEDSGDFKRAFRFFVNQEEYFGSLETIPLEAEVWIINDAPYLRRQETGSQKTSKDSHFIEKLAIMIRRKFPILETRVRYVNLHGTGKHPKAKVLPYRLQNQGYRINRYGRRGGKRSDMTPGQPITYPAVIMRMRET